MKKKYKVYYEEICQCESIIEADSKEEAERLTMSGSANEVPDFMETDRTVNIVNTVEEIK